MFHTKHFNKIGHIGLAFVAAILVSDVLLFLGTNASKVSVGVIILSFCLLLVNIWCVINAMLRFLSLYGLSSKHRRKLTGYLTMFVGCTIALQSVGELNRRDVLVLAPLIVLAYAYSVYAKSDARNLDAI